MVTKDYSEIIRTAQSYARFTSPDLWLAIKDQVKMSEDEWRCNMKMAESFLCRYAISEEEYKEYWFPRKCQVFENPSNNRSMEFVSGMTVLKNIGGYLMDASELSYLNECLSFIGETRFLIETEEDIGLGIRMRFVFPVGISREELAMGSSVAACVFLGGYGMFRIWGTIPEWGIATNTDALDPWIFKAFSPFHKEAFQTYWRKCYELNRDVEDEWRYKEGNNRPAYLRTVAIGDILDRMELSCPYSERQIGRMKAYEFFQKYLITASDEIGLGNQRKNEVFINMSCPSIEIFRTGMVITKHRGGFVFSENDFSYFNQCLASIGEKSFYMEVNDNSTFGQLLLSFPVGMTWEEIKRGGNIIQKVFSPVCGIYHIWGTLSVWGMATDTDADNPVFYCACNPDYEVPFQQYWDIRRKLEDESIRDEKT